MGRAGKLPIAGKSMLQRGVGHTTPLRLASDVGERFVTRIVPGVFMPDGVFTGIPVR